MLAVAVGVAVFLIGRRGEEAPRRAADDAVPAPATGARGGTASERGTASGHAAAEHATPARDASAASPSGALGGDATPGSLLLPDGSRVPALNGISGEIRLLWPPDRAPSPIVGREVSTTGLEWYVHADGTRSTTQWFTHDDGRREAVATVAAPIPVVGR